MKFVVKHVENDNDPVELSFILESDGCVVIKAQKGGVNASIAELTSDGRLIRIVNDPKKLEKLGFMIQNGKIKEF